MVKYKSIFQKMLSENNSQFSAFGKVYSLYSEDPKRWKKEFDQAGKGILAIIRRYENLLCGKSENCGYGSFSSNLSAKFWDEIRQSYPQIDEIGIE